MKLGEAKRVKHGEQPGDISRRAKIALREMHVSSPDVVAHPWQRLTIKTAKAFRRYLQQKAKKRQRRRNRETILEQLDDMHDS